MLSQFRSRYPQGSLTSDLLEIDRGLYLVKVTVQVEGIILATGLAAQPSLEQAEDLARSRALMTLNLEITPEIPAPPLPEPPTLTAPVAAPLPPEPETQPLSPPPETTLPEVAPLPPEPETPSAAPVIETRDLTVSPPPTPELESIVDITKALPLPIPEPQPKTKTKKKDPLPEVLPEPEPILELTPPPEESNGDNGHSAEAEPDLPRMTWTAPEAGIGLEAPDTSPEEPEAGESLDFADIIARSNIELKRLGWTSEQGRNYLLQTYGKRSRQLLSDEELLEFVQYLESLPNP
ncbi:MAG: hypothetical protein VKN60_04960 [Cyanobacteriota bacterium]|nr:hypothetical protein [Cyanobacteriota bacterium]